MLQKKNKKGKQNKFYLPNSRFVTLVRNIDGKVTPWNGMIVLHDVENNKPYSLPVGVTMPLEMYGEPISFLVRLVTEEVILELGPQDMLLEDYDESDEKIIAVDNYFELEQTLAELKADSFGKMTKYLYNIVGGFCLVFACFYARNSPVIPAPFLLASTILGVFGAIFRGVIPTVKFISSFSSSRLYDCTGHYVDVETGKSNMNGGMRFPNKNERW